VFRDFSKFFCRSLGDVEAVMQVAVRVRVRVVVVEYIVRV
jgi:hypothetical protein